MWNDFRDRAVLITGGTKGIGLATGLSFAKRGAKVTLTCRWGSADEDQLAKQFVAAGGHAPTILEADVNNDDGINEVVEHLKRQHDAVDVFVSNVAFGALARSMADVQKKALHQGIDYSSWPIVSHLQALEKAFGSYPRYAIAVSSQGAESMHHNYDLIAASKAVLETLCRYLAPRLRPEGTRLNVVRTRFCATESLDATFGEEFRGFVEEYSPGLFTSPEAIGEAIYGLCSGLFDGMVGEILDVDGGASVFDNFSRLYTERDENPLGEKLARAKGTLNEP